jgi:hypothetical protein
VKFSRKKYDNMLSDNTVISDNSERPDGLRQNSERHDGLRQNSKRHDSLKQNSDKHDCFLSE